MTKPGHIFFSYPSFEADFGLHLARALKNKGVNLWMDRLEGIRPGEDWRRAIEEAVDSCVGMIAVLSPAYISSKYCLRELARADSMNKPVFPVLSRPISPQPLPIEVQRIQYINFSAWPDAHLFDQKFEELLVTLKSRAPDQIGEPLDPEQQYLLNLIARLEARRGVLKYVPLAGEAVRPNPRWAEEWGLDEALVNLETQLQRKQQSANGSPSSGPKEQSDSIVNLLKDHTRFVLLGVPGAGKTTILQRLALETARDRQANPKTSPLPLLLALPNWRDEQSVSEFVRSQWPFKTDPMAPLASGDISLFLDGLNEMGAKGSDKAKDLRKWLDDDGGPRRVIITCRLHDYAGDFVLGLPTATARELDDRRIREFAANYLEEDTDSFLARVIPNGKDKADNRHLLHLARNPYLLTLLILVYKNLPGGDLPQNLGELFQHIAQNLWEREHHRQTLGWRPWPEVQPAFAHLAFRMMEEGRPTQVPLDYAVGHLGDESMLWAGVSASLLTIQGQNVSYYHQLMQEYFAAVWLARNGLSGQVERARFSYSTAIFSEAFGVRAGKWDQVIVALYGISEKPEDVIQEVASVNPYLALTCIESGRRMSIPHETWSTMVRGFFQEIRYRSNELPRIEEYQSQYGYSTRGYDEAGAAIDGYEEIITHTAGLILRVGQIADQCPVEFFDEGSGISATSVAEILQSIGAKYVLEKWNLAMQAK